MGNQLNWAAVLIVASFVGGLFLGKSTKEKKPIGKMAKIAELAGPELSEDDQEHSDALNQNEIIEEQVKELDRLQGEVTVLEKQLKQANDVCRSDVVVDVSTPAKPAALGPILEPGNPVSSPEGDLGESASEPASRPTSDSTINPTTNSAVEPSSAQAPKAVDLQTKTIEKPQPAIVKQPTVAELEQNLVSGGENSLQTLANLRWTDLRAALSSVQPISDSLMDKMPEGNFTGSNELGQYRLKVSKAPKQNQAPVYLSISDQDICSWEWSEVVQPSASELGIALECADQVLQIYPNTGSGKGYLGTAFVVDPKSGSTKSNHAFELIAR